MSLLTLRPSPPWESHGLFCNAFVPRRVCSHLQKTRSAVHNEHIEVLGQAYWSSPQNQAQNVGTRANQGWKWVRRQSSANGTRGPVGAIFVPNKAPVRVSPQCAMARGPGLPGPIYCARTGCVQGTCVAHLFSWVFLARRLCDKVVTRLSGHRLLLKQIDYVGKTISVPPTPPASKHRLVQSPCGGDTVTFCTIAFWCKTDF